MIVATITSLSAAIVIPARGLRVADKRDKSCVDKLDGGATHGAFRDILSGERLVAGRGG